MLKGEKNASEKAPLAFTLPSFSWQFSESLKPFSVYLPVIPLEWVQVPRVTCVTALGVALVLLAGLGAWLCLPFLCSAVGGGAAFWARSLSLNLPGS